MLQPLFHVNLPAAPVRRLHHRQSLRLRRPHVTVAVAIVQVGYNTGAQRHADDEERPSGRIPEGKQIPFAIGLQGTDIC
jgi:hypothetical protein